jgi:4-diphosphocytidyl-2-C-methyl-D-erythritol kinase
VFDFRKSVKDILQQDRDQNIVLKAPAKINLFLKILGRRPDGYHEIVSLMQKVELFDTLHLTREGNTILLACPESGLPEDKGNLVYRAAEAFFAATGMKTGIKIVLEKKIPVAAGLGGGSSDAAAVIKGLDSLLGTGMPEERLVQIARPLGADVPFFVCSCGAAIATGIGDCLDEVESTKGLWLLLVNPGFSLSTKWAYENFPLTSCANPYILARVRKMQANQHETAPGSYEELGNDLEAVSISRFPEIGEIKNELKQGGAVVSLMSGSGPTVFGLFSSEEEAQRSFLQLSKKYGENVFLVRPYIP